MKLIVKGQLLSLHLSFSLHFRSLDKLAPSFSMAEACTRTLQTTLIPAFSSLKKPYSSCHQRAAFPRHAAVHCSVSTGSRTAVDGQKIPWGWDVDSLENASALQQWLSDSGLPPQKMAIQRVKVGERGLVALKNIRKGEKLLFVPPSLVITADSVRC